MINRPDETWPEDDPDHVEQPEKPTDQSKPLGAIPHAPEDGPEQGPPVTGSPTEAGPTQRLPDDDVLPGQHADGTITVDSLPDRGEFVAYKRKTGILAMRMPGPFKVQTLEGVMTCENGWLALDANGYPYPIADDVFNKTYQPADLN